MPLRGIKQRKNGNGAEDSTAWKPYNNVPMFEPLRHNALLLLGPTGSGKTPLGDELQKRGYRGRRCLHFDFGAALRRLVDRDQPDEVVSRADLDFLSQVLASGALLEDEQFPLAERVLRSFLLENRAAADDLIVLNGLPRHVGQAVAIEAILTVVEIALLECPAEVVVARLRTNAGGDREGRADDHLSLVRRKLAIYAERTEPLVKHYERSGVPIRRVAVTATATPEETWRELEANQR